MRERRQRHVGARIGLAGGLCLLGLAGTSTDGGAAGSPVTRVSVSSAGAQTTTGSDYPVLSGDGQWVAFESGSPELVPGDVNGRFDVFVRSLTTGAVERVSLTNGGGEATGDSDQATISEDGRFVAFRSSAANLVPLDTNGVQDIFVRDRVAGTTTRASVSTAGAQGGGVSDTPSISGDGSRIAFRSVAPNLIANDTQGYIDVFVRDLVAGTTVRASVSSTGTYAAGTSFQPAISADGRHVAFSTYGFNLVPQGTNDRSQIFVRHLDTGITDYLSTSPTGASGTGDSTRPAISSDGSLVVFRSGAPNLVAGDTNGVADIFVRDLRLGSTSRLPGASGGQPDGVSDEPSISANGRVVGFRSDATNLVAGDTNGLADVFVRDLQLGTNRRVSAPVTGQTNAVSSRSSVSRDGTKVAFRSFASNLVAGDTNNQADIFLLDQGRLAAPDLMVTVAEGADPVLAGSPTFYTFTVLNRGDAPASGVVLSSPVPPGTTFRSASSSTVGGCSLSGASVTCPLGGLAAGASATVTISFNTAAAPTSISASATATSVEADGNAADNTATESTTTGLPDLVTSVTDQADPVAPGQPVRDTISVTNTGIVAGTGVVIGFEVPATTSFVSATGPQGRCAVSGTSINCYVGTLAAGSTTLATVVLGTTSDANVVLTATATASEPDVNPASNTASQATTVGLPDLHPTVTTSANPVAFGAPFTVTAAVRNDGTARSNAGVATFAIPTGTTFVGATGPGGPCSYTSVITCPLGAVAVSAEARATATFEAEGDGSAVNVSVTSSNISQSDRNPANDTSVIPVTLQAAPAPDLGIQVVADQEVVAPGADIGLVATLSNTGSRTATGVVLTDVLPAGTVAVGAVPSTGTCSLDASQISCQLGSLAVGANASVRLTLSSATDRTVVNRVSVRSAEQAPNDDPDPSNNTASTTTIVGRPDLATTITLQPAQARLGSNVTVQALVGNNGTAPSDATSVRIAVPAGVVIVSASVAGAACPTDAAGATCGLGRVTVGSSATATVVVRPSGAGAVPISATASSSRADRNPSDDATTSTLTVVAPDLALAVTAPASPAPLGQDLSYVATTTNNGTAAALSPVVRLVIPVGSTVVSASTAGSACAVATDITCPLADLAVGQSQAVTVVLRPARAGVTTLAASVSSASPDAATGDDAASASATVVAPNLLLEVLNYRDFVTVGTDVTYRYSVTNNGTASATSVQLATTLPASTTLRSIVPSPGSTCTVTGASISCALAPLAVGGVARVTITIRPDVERLVSHAASVTSAQVDDDPADNSGTGVIRATTVSEYAVPAWQTNGVVYAVARIGGTIYVGGSFTSIRPPRQPAGTGEQPRANAAAFDAVTGQPLPWNPGFNLRVLSFAAATDGATLFVGGDFTSVGGTFRNHIARVQAGSGALTTWAPDVNAVVRTIATAPDGQNVFVGGGFSYAAGVPRARAVKLSTVTGAANAAWNPVIDYPATPTANNVRSLAISPDGSSVYIGGVFTTVNGQSHQSIAKVDAATGASAAAWDPGMEKKVNKNESEVYAIVAAGDKVFICGDYYKIGTAESPNLGAVDAGTGQRRTDWIATTDGAVNACAASSTRLYVGGHFDRLGGYNADPHTNPNPTGEIRHHIGSIELSDGTVTLWDPGATEVEGFYALAITADTVIAGGQQLRAGHWFLQQGAAWFTGQP